MKTMKGCPSFDDLEKCEWNPQQKWCMTTQDTCKQQVGDMVGDGWACKESRDIPPVEQPWLNNPVDP